MVDFNYQLVVECNVILLTVTVSAAKDIGIDLSVFLIVGKNMIKLRFQKVMLFGGVFTVLFIIYQLSYGDTKNDNSKEFLVLKDIENSLKNSRVNVDSQNTMALKYMSPLDQNKVNDILSEGE